MRRVADLFFIVVIFGVSTVTRDVAGPTVDAVLFFGMTLGYFHSGVHAALSSRDAIAQAPMVRFAFSMSSILLLLGMAKITPLI